MAYGVRITPRAAEDAEKIYRRVVEAAPESGQRWFNGLIDRLFTLREFPERCQTVEKLTRGERIIRRLLYGRKPDVYWIYSEIRGDVVTVLYIRHLARREPRRI